MIRPAPEPLKLSNERAIASRIPSPKRLVSVELSGAAVGAWALDHWQDDIWPWFIVGGGPEYRVNCCGTLAYGPVEITGQLLLRMPFDTSEIPNNLAAAQLALEQIEQLPEAERLAHASFRIEIEETR